MERDGKGKGSIRLQKAIAMAIDDLNRLAIGDGNMVRLNADNLAVFLVGGIDGEVAPPATGLVHEPEVGEGGGEGGGDVSDGICAEVGQEVIEDRGEEEDPRGEEAGCEHVCGWWCWDEECGWAGNDADGGRVDFQCAIMKTL